MGGWYCVNCGTTRSLGDFSTACDCGGQAMACDEEHRFTIEELRKMGHVTAGVDLHYLANTAEEER